MKKKNLKQTNAGAHLVQYRSVKAVSDNDDNYNDNSEPTNVRCATDTIVADVEKMRMVCCTEETSWIQQRTVE